MASNTVSRGPFTTIHAISSNFYFVPYMLSIGPQHTHSDPYNGVDLSYHTRERACVMTLSFFMTRNEVANFPINESFEILLSLIVVKKQII